MWKLLTNPAHSFNILPYEGFFIIEIWTFVSWKNRPLWRYIYLLLQTNHTITKTKTSLWKKEIKNPKRTCHKHLLRKVNGKLFLVKTLNLKFLQSKKMKFRFPWFRTIWYAILRSWLRQKSHQGNWLVLPCIQDEVESIWYHEIPSFAPGLLKIHDETNFHSWDIFHHWLIDQLDLSYHLRQFHNPFLEKKRNGKIK